MKPTSRPGRRIGSAAALLLAASVAGCGAPDSGTFDEIALPTFSKDRVAGEAPVEVRRVLSAGNWGVTKNSPSPDGRYLTDARFEDGRLALVDVQTGVRTLLTDDNLAGSFGHGGSVFSPDGQRIAYNVTATGGGQELRSVGIDGSDVRVHASAPEDLIYPTDWSRDGRYVLAQRLAAHGEPEQIVRVDMETNEMRVLKEVLGRPPHQFFGWGQAFFSPDGRFVAFGATVDEDSNTKDIFGVSSDGTEETDLIRTPEDEDLLGWLPDGSGILFYRVTRDSQAIWKLPIRNGRASGPPELVKDDVWGIEGLGFSDDAFFYAVHVRHGGVHVASIDPEAGRVLDGPTPVSQRPSRAPAWSPDGGRLAYIEQVAGEDWIVIRAVTGEVLQEIPSPILLSRWPVLVWVQDGILANSWDEGIYLISLETGEATRLMEAEEGTEGRSTQGILNSFVVSEDGSTVYYPQEGGTFWTPGRQTQYDPRTRTEKALDVSPSYTPTALPEHPTAQVVRSRVSPDLNKIAHIVWETPSRDHGAAAVEIVSVSGELLASARMDRIYIEGGGGTWSRDSGYFFFPGVDEGAERGVRALSVEDGALRHFPDIPQPTLSSDGRHIAFMAGPQPNEVWRMTFNDGGR